MPSTYLGQSCRAPCQIASTSPKIPNMTFDPVVSTSSLKLNETKTMTGPSWQNLQILCRVTLVFEPISAVFSWKTPLYRDNGLLPPMRGAFSVPAAGVASGARVISTALPLMSVSADDDAVVSEKEQGEGRKPVTKRYRLHSS